MTLSCKILSPLTFCAPLPWRLQVNRVVESCYYYYHYLLMITIREWAQLQYASMCRNTADAAGESHPEDIVKSEHLKKPVFLTQWSQSTISSSHYMRSTGASCTKTGFPTKLSYAQKYSDASMCALARIQAVSFVHLGQRGIERTGRFATVVPVYASI